METDPTTPPTTAGNSNVRKGVLLALISAVTYSGANLALKGLAVRHADLGWAIWVSAMKALPTVILAVALMSGRVLKKQTLFPDRKVLPALFFAAVVMQFGGNVGFQVALAYLGLAITVPLVFAFIICSGALLGRMFLGDSVSFRTVVSMIVMTTSIGFLSYAATLTSSETPVTDLTLIPVAAKLVGLGILVAVISGLSYGVNGVVIRSVGKQSLPIESMLLVYSLTGVVLLGIVGSAMMGGARLSAIRLDEWQMMIMAGTFNALAFWCVCHALKVMKITQVNVVNASQNAMCAVGAVIMFAEPLSWPLVLGVALSILGLVVLDRG